MRKWFDKILSFQSLWKSFYPQIQKYQTGLWLSLLCGILSLLLSLLEPWPLKMIFDNLFWEEPLPAFLAPLSSYFKERKLLILNLLIAISATAALCRAFLSHLQRSKSSKIGQQIACEIQSELYRHLHDLPLSFHQKHPTGDLLSRLTTDIHSLRSHLISLPFAFILDWTLAFVTILILCWMDWLLALVTLTTIPVLMLLVKRYRTPFKQAMRKQRQRESHLSQLAHEGLSGSHVIQSLNREASEVEKFGAQNRNSLKKGLKATRLEAKLHAASEVSIAVTSALIFAIGGMRVLQSDISPGELIVFAHYLRIFHRPLKRISKVIEQMSRIKASGERILHLLDSHAPVEMPKEGENLAKVQGEIRYENVSFEYHPGHPILQSMSFSVASKQKIAFVGPSGVGKSTLAALLPRFYDCTSGKIYIDGVDTRDWRIASLRKNICMVFQDPMLFSGTIADNIAYGSPEATREEIVSAAQRSGIHPLIERLPKGYDTLVGEHGAHLSGGQKQCIAIARAMIKNAPIVILDEPTARLDKEARQLVMEAIDRLIENKTVLIISHQAELLKNVDQIITLGKKN